MAGTEESAHSPGSESPATQLVLSLIIPAYNEGDRLGDGVQRIHSAVSSGALVPATTEFLVVDDGSSDDTAARAAALLAPYPHVRVIRLPENRGKGAAVRAGVAAASAPIVAFADADMAIDPAQTPEFIAALARADLAIGSRAASGSTVDRSSMNRSVMNRVFNRMVNLLTGVALQDTQCGFKSFRAPAAKLLFHCTTTERFAFDVEVLSLARRFGFTIAEVPVHWRRVKGSRIRPWFDSGSMARDVLRTRQSISSAPPIPALTVKLPGDGAVPGAPGSLRVALRFGSLPAIAQPDGSMLILCPLMSESEVAETAAQLATSAPGALVERSVVTAAQLSASAPVSLTWDDDPTISVPV
jgi:glycosyl transferase family 2